MTARVFRLFVSSTFSDFIAEREALQKDVFPKLELYCAQRGARFQAVDLRWGITEEAQREHDTMRICLEEVRRCQQLSPRPNFAVLLGDRYGWEPVPARIPQDHWKRLRAQATQEDLRLIQANYRLDENAIPPVYCLNKRTGDLSGAYAQEMKLLHALRRLAKGFRGSARLPYFASATHQEIVLGALSRHDEHGVVLDPGRHVHVYVRHLQHLPQDASAKEYIDWDASQGQVVPGARQRLRSLENQLRRQLGHQVHDLQTPWSRHGRQGAVNQAYLRRFCEAFLADQKQLIDAALAALDRVEERQQREGVHQEFGAERARVFAGRGTLLARIARYTASRGKPTTPMILLGGGGSGKSALLARAAQNDLKQCAHTATVVLQRYIGGVPGTESLMSTLAALTADIHCLYGHTPPTRPESVKALTEAFEAALACASANRPLVLYLDALDQLDQSDSAWMLEWLPDILPEHVRMVVSARKGTSVEQSARRRDPHSIVDVPPMKPAEGRAMLDAWLKDKRAAWFNAGIVPSAGRRLAPRQRTALLAAFNRNGSALWLKLAYEEAATWASWDKPRKLSTTVQGLIEDLVDQRLIRQENHPKVFTERALAYLTAGRFGLSEVELGRALGADSAVRAEFRAQEKTQMKWADDKSLPPILWSRLFFDLKAYLGLARLDGALMMRWFHREFGDVLKARYLGTAQDRQDVHGALADSFGDLDRSSRSYPINDDTLYMATDIGGTQVSAALRRVMEQPWQLAMANRQQDLLALVNDFGFCMAKCAANRSVDLVADLLRARGEDAQASSWASRLSAWNHLLARADSAWPAHRILLQLVLEAPQFEQHSVAVQGLRRGDFKWPVYLKGASSSYSAPLAFPIRLPLGWLVLEDRLDTDFKGRVMYDPAAKTLKIESSSRYLTNIRKLALIGRRHLLAVNARDEAFMSDVLTGEVLQMGPLQAVMASVPRAKIKWTQLEKDSIGDERAPYSVRQVSRTPGSAPLVMKGGKGSVILGKEPVFCVAELADSAATLLACDGNLFLLYPEDLAQVDAGVYNYLGEKLMVAEPQSQDYERFGSIVFLGPARFLSLGFQSVSGDGRENIQIELFEIQADDVRKVSDISLENTIDLPVPVVAGTRDGGVFLTCENYLRTFAFWPPFEKEMYVERVAATWYEHERLKDRSGQPRLLIQFKVPYGSFFREEELAWTAQGGFGKWPSIHLPACHSLLDADDNGGPDFLRLGAGDSAGRWYCDVPFQFAIQLKQGAVLVIRSTGPVIVRRATRSRYVAIN